MENELRGNYFFLEVASIYGNTIVITWDVWWMGKIGLWKANAEKNLEKPKEWFKFLIIYRPYVFVCV